MANDYDFEGGAGPGFLVGLLAGAALGAGLGLLFAPKKGRELRGQLADSASTIGRAASDGYHKVAGAVSAMADRGRDVGREVMARAKGTADRGGVDARQYGREPSHAAAISSAVAAS